MGQPATFQRKFFIGFTVGRFIAKASGLFVGLLTVGALLAEWSQPIADLKADFTNEAWGLPLAYGAWMSLFFGYELLRRKLRYDLAEARWQNAQIRKRKGRGER